MLVAVRETGIGLSPAGHAYAIDRVEHALTSVRDHVRKVMGIVNGTTNFVLDKMDVSGAGFAETVEQAQALGYAEADPTADVEGFDAAAKAAILASLAFHTRVSSADVHREGITEVSAADIRAASEMDAVVKLLWCQGAIRQAQKALTTATGKESLTIGQIQIIVLRSVSYRLRRDPIRQRHRQEKAAVRPSRLGVGQVFVQGSERRFQPGRVECFQFLNLGR